MPFPGANRPLKDRKVLCRNRGLVHPVSTPGLAAWEGQCPLKEQGGYSKLHLTQFPLFDFISKGTGGLVPASSTRLHALRGPNRAFERTPGGKKGEGGGSQSTPRLPISTPGSAAWGGRCPFKFGSPNPFGKPKAPPSLPTLLAPGVPQDRKAFEHEAHCEERPPLTYIHIRLSDIVVLLGRRVSSSAQSYAKFEAL